ncbi:hypothetical protein [Coprobacter secundus]|uniref:gliding motility lipoprotein GldD n=1 Tax=Coprobacter secundus TaxID=1501392 RepID=UPI0022E5ED2C|nr:hypothetical protein [Coprobacter secundus]
MKIKKSNKKKHYIYSLWILSLILICITLISCRQEVTPKPNAFFRIDPDTSSYQSINSNLPVSFEIAASAYTVNDTNHILNKWVNIIYPYYHATLYCSYHLANKLQNIYQLLDENKSLVYQHSIKAEQITAQNYTDSINNIYATLYQFQGNTATPIQFTITDSSKYLFRGALYFDFPIRNDSIAPVLGYLKSDIIHLIETFKIHN